MSSVRQLVCVVSVSLEYYGSLFNVEFSYVADDGNSLFLRDARDMMQIFSNRVNMVYNLKSITNWELLRLLLEENLIPYEVSVLLFLQVLYVSHKLNLLMCNSRLS